MSPTISKILYGLGVLAMLTLSSCASSTGAVDQQPAPLKTVFSSEETELSDTTTVYATSTEELRSNEIPAEVFELTDLHHLSVQGEDCDYRTLDANGNDITECWMIYAIPPQIKNLTHLETLYLNVNAISEIPSEISALHSLKTLVLDDNPGLSKIDPIATLDSLEDLSLNGCNIERMPEAIGNLKRLKSLGLVGNRIEKVEQERIQRVLPLCRVYF